MTSWDDSPADGGGRENSWNVWLIMKKQPHFQRMTEWKHLSRMSHSFVEISPLSSLKKSHHKHRLSLARSVQDNEKSKITLFPDGSCHATKACACMYVTHNLWMRVTMVLKAAWTSAAEHVETMGWPCSWSNSATYCTETHTRGTPWVNGLTRGSTGRVGKKAKTCSYDKN